MKMILFLSGQQQCRKVNSIFTIFMKNIKDSLLQLASHNNARTTDIPLRNHHHHLLLHHHRHPEREGQIC